MQSFTAAVIRKRWLLGGIGMAVLCGFHVPLHAEDWMFRRSYYSHTLTGDLPPGYPQPISRSAYRPAYYPDGFSVSAAYRVNNFVLQNGNRVDRTLYTEGWFQFQPRGE